MGGLPWHCLSNFPIFAIFRPRVRSIPRTLLSQHSRGPHWPFQVRRPRTVLRSTPASATTSFLPAAFSAFFNTNQHAICFLNFLFSSFHFPYSYYQPLTATTSRTAAPSHATGVFGSHHSRHRCLFFHQYFLTFSRPSSWLRYRRQRSLRYHRRPSPPSVLETVHDTTGYELAGFSRLLLARPLH